MFVHAIGIWSVYYCSGGIVILLAVFYLILWIFVSYFLLVPLLSRWKGAFRTMASRFLDGFLTFFLLTPGLQTFDAADFARCSHLSAEFAPRTSVNNSIASVTGTTLNYFKRQPHAEG